MKKYNRIVYDGCAVACLVDVGVQRYDRAVMLPRLLPEEASGVGLLGVKDTRGLCLRLLLALRRERGRGRAGHWSYSFNRHLGLMQAYRAERQALAAMERSAQNEKSPAEGRAP